MACHLIDGMFVLSIDHTFESCFVRMQEEVDFIFNLWEYYVTLTPISLEGVTGRHAQNWESCFHCQKTDSGSPCRC